MPPDPPSRHSTYALITYSNPHFKNSRSATGEITCIKKLQPPTCINSWQINFSFIWLWQVLSSSSSSSSCRMGSFSHRITWLLPERICPCKTMVTYCNYSPEFLVRSALHNSTELQIPWKQKEQSLVCAVVPIWYGSWYLLLKLECCMLVTQNMTCLKSTALLAVFAHIARAGKWSRIFCTLHAVGLYYSLNRHMEYIRQIIEKSTIRLTSVELAQACPNDLIKVQIIELVFSIVYSLFCVHQLWSSHCCTIISRLVVSLSRSTHIW